MRNILLSESWESFYIEGHKVGLLHRKTTPDNDDPQILTSTLTIMYGLARFQHIFSFYDEIGYPPHSYIFDTNDGAPVHVRFTQDEMICQIDEAVFIEAIPANARPSYGNYPLIVTIPFEEGAKLSFTQIEDASCTAQGVVDLVSLGQDTVTIDKQQHHLWLVGEYRNGQAGNRYWLDKDRCVRKSDWKGATSYWVANKEEALKRLPRELIEDAEGLFDESHDSDWTARIVDWLNQNS